MKIKKFIGVNDAQTVKALNGGVHMKRYSFKSKSICSELNITNIAEKYGITKKVKWEEPLILNGDKLQDIKNYEDKIIYIYHFGAIVFVNFHNDEIDNFINYIKCIPNSIKSLNADMKYDFSEEYEMIEDETASEEDLGFDTYMVNKVESSHLNMIALVLAKSVALEPIEAQINIVIDETEPIILSLRKGKLRLNGKKLASLIGRILSFRHTTISYIGLLDKPAAAWKSQNAENFFNDLADNFELTARYDTINAKTDALLSTTEIFANLTHSKRSTILEVIVVILIFVELIILDQSIFKPVIDFFTHF